MELAEEPKLVRKVSRGPRRGRAADPEQLAAPVTMWNEGETLAAIGERLVISETAAYAQLKRVERRQVSGRK